MATELKIRIKGYKKVEEKLIKLSAKFLEETNVVDTYFHQPPGIVLKITEENRGNFLVGLKAKNGKFDYTKNEEIKGDVEKLKRELANQFGIKRILRKKMRFWDFGEFKININLIDKVGEFFILEGENPTPDFITDKLKIKNPEFITVPFSELPEQR